MFLRLKVLIQLPLPVSYVLDWSKLIVVCDPRNQLPETVYKLCYLVLRLCQVHIGVFEKPRRNMSESWKTFAFHNRLHWHNCCEYSKYHSCHLLMLFNIGKTSLGMSRCLKKYVLLASVGIQWLQRCLSCCLQSVLLIQPRSKKTVFIFWNVLFRNSTDMPLHFDRQSSVSFICLPRSWAVSTRESWYH